MLPEPVIRYRSARPTAVPGGTCHSLATKPSGGFLGARTGATDPEATYRKSASSSQSGRATPIKPMGLKTTVRYASGSGMRTSSKHRSASELKMEKAYRVSLGELCFNAFDEFFFDDPTERSQHRLTWYEFVVPREFMRSRGAARSAPGAASVDTSLRMLSVVKPIVYPPEVKSKVVAALVT